MLALSNFSTLIIAAKIGCIILYFSIWECWFAARVESGIILAILCLLQGCVRSGSTKWILSLASSGSGLRDPATFDPIIKAVCIVYLGVRLILSYKGTSLRLHPYSFHFLWCIVEEEVLLQRKATFFCGCQLKGSAKKLIKAHHCFFFRTKTVVVFTAQPTCITQMSCEECAAMRLTSPFRCSWCPSVHRCSDGADRLREHWDQVL